MHAELDVILTGVDPTLGDGVAQRCKEQQDFWLFQARSRQRLTGLLYQIATSLEPLYEG